MPGNGGTVGSATGGAEVVQATEKEGKETPATNALLDALRSKGLAEKETNETVEGLLYFPLDGKVKLKDLLLIYKAPGGKMELRFLRK
ncbi:MAG: hypothetical protein K2Q23_01125, partial [Bryobacteraceae bacterium]|nr:hypothetical protein [Bryobacteraceae bacterium]